MSQSPSSGASGSRDAGGHCAPAPATPPVAIPFERGIRFTASSRGLTAQTAASRNPLRAGHPVHGRDLMICVSKGIMSQSPSSGASGSRVGPGRGAGSPAHGVAIPFERGIRFTVFDGKGRNRRFGSLSQSPSSGASGSRAANPTRGCEAFAAASQSPSSGASGSRSAHPPRLRPHLRPSQSPSSGASGSRFAAALQCGGSKEQTSQSPSSGASGSRQLCTGCAWVDLRVAIPFERGIRFTGYYIVRTDYRRAWSQSPSSGASGSRPYNPTTCAFECQAGRNPLRAGHPVHGARAKSRPGPTAVGRRNPLRAGHPVHGCDPQLICANKECGSSQSPSSGASGSRGYQFQKGGLLHVHLCRNPLRAGHPVHGSDHDRRSTARQWRRNPLRAGHPVHGTGGPAGTGVARRAGRNPLRAGHPVHGSSREQTWSDCAQSGRNPLRAGHPVHGRRWTRTSSWTAVCRNPLRAGHPVHGR